MHVSGSKKSAKQQQQHTHTHHHYHLLTPFLPLPLCRCAQQYNLPHIIFGGSFIRDHPYTIATISTGVRFYSRGKCQPLFLKHDGFVGAVGAHVAGLEEDVKGLPKVVRMPDSEPAASAHAGAAPPLRDFTVPGAPAGPPPQPDNLEERFAAESQARRELEAELSLLRQQMGLAGSGGTKYGHDSPSPKSKQESSSSTTTSSSSESAGLGP